jgi:hypothetical protein
MLWGSGLRRGGQRFVGGQFGPVIDIGQLVPIAAVPPGGVSGGALADGAGGGHRGLTIVGPALAAAVGPTALRARNRRPATVVTSARGTLVKITLRVVAAAFRPALLVSAPPLLAAVIRAAAGTRARAGPVAPRTPGGPPGTARASVRSLPALITKSTVVLAAAGSAPALTPVGELVGILGAHVSNGNNDNDEDYHDNYGQYDHELGHRTIQQAWPHRAVQARHTRPSTRAFTVCASTLDLIRG